MVTCFFILWQMKINFDHIYIEYKFKNYIFFSMWINTATLVKQITCNAYNFLFLFFNIYLKNISTIILCNIIKSKKKKIDILEKKNYKNIIYIILWTIYCMVTIQKTIS